MLNLREGMDEFVYLISAELKDLVPENVRKARIYPTINEFGTVALWRINYPWEGGRRGRKSFDTALAAAERAKTAWSRAIWNRDTGSYDVLIAKGDLGVPRWPDVSFRDMLATAFDDLVYDRRTTSASRAGRRAVMFSLPISEDLGPGLRVHLGARGSPRPGLHGCAGTEVRSADQAVARRAGPDPAVSDRRRDLVCGLLLQRGVGFRPPAGLAAADQGHRSLCRVPPRDQRDGEKRALQR